LLAVVIVCYARTPLDELLTKPQKLNRDKNPPQQPLTFKWNTCGNPTGVVIKSLSVTPDPVPLGGDINVVVSVSVTEQISSTSVRTIPLTLEKSVLGVWVELPCIDNAGSCTYQDPCALLAKAAEQCNSTKMCICNYTEPIGVPCVCPFSPKLYGPYTLPPIHIHNPEISWLTDGDYYAKVEIADASGKDVLCTEVYVSLTSVFEDLRINVQLEIDEDLNRATIPPPTIPPPSTFAHTPLFSLRFYGFAFSVSLAAVPRPVHISICTSRSAPSAMP